MTVADDMMMTAILSVLCIGYSSIVIVYVGVAWRGMWYSSISYSIILKLTRK
jgi:hypothetical protein